jgi:hypothetical protein
MAPPSATSVAPLTIDDSFARNRQQFAISSAVPGRRAARSLSRGQAPSRPMPVAPIPSIDASAIGVPPTWTERVRADPADRDQRRSHAPARSARPSRESATEPGDADRAFGGHQHHGATPALEHRGQRRPRHHHRAGRPSRVRRQFPSSMSPTEPAAPPSRHTPMSRPPNAATAAATARLHGSGRSVAGDGHAVNLRRDRLDRFGSATRHHHLRSRGEQPRGGRPSLFRRR